MRADHILRPAGIILMAYSLANVVYTYYANGTSELSFENDYALKLNNFVIGLISFVVGKKLKIRDKEAEQIQC